MLGRRHRWRCRWRCWCCRLCSCVAFGFPVKLSLPQPRGFLTFTLLILSPIPWGRGSEGLRGAELPAGLKPQPCSIPEPPGAGLGICSIQAPACCPTLWPPAFLLLCPSPSSQPLAFPGVTPLPIPGTPQLPRAPKCFPPPTGCGTSGQFGHKSCGRPGGCQSVCLG